MGRLSTGAAQVKHQGNAAILMGRCALRNQHSAKRPTPLALVEVLAGR